MFNRIKDMKLDKAKIEITEVTRYCLCGLNENECRFLDPYGIGFDQFEFIDARLKYVEDTYIKDNTDKEIALLVINLEAVKEKYELRKQNTKGRTR